MRKQSYGRRGRVYSGNRMFIASALALLALGDLWLLAHLDALSFTLPVALRQPLVAAVLVGVAMLPALALRAAETALRPRLQLMAPAIHPGASAAHRRSQPRRSSSSRASR